MDIGVQLKSSSGITPNAVGFNPSENYSSIKVTFNPDRLLNRSSTSSTFFGIAPTPFTIVVPKEAQVGQYAIPVLVNISSGSLFPAKSIDLLDFNFSVPNQGYIEANGPTTSQELSRIACINQRYAKEWLNAMACAGYLEYDITSQRFRLPPEHAPVLTEEGGPMFVSGIYQRLLADVKNMEKIVEVFRQGGGIPLKEFDENKFVGMDRMTASWFENLLLQEWIPAVPDVKTKLEKGAIVADAGCGRGRAIIKLAQAFPNSRFVGYDIFKPAIEHARSQSVSTSISDRVSFQRTDISKGFPPEEKYDLITTFDVIHDMTNPQAALKSIHQALKPDGTYLWLEINCKDRLEDNFGAIGALFYCWSIMYCMTTSLAEGGQGLGTLGMPPSKVKEYCNEAGFTYVRKLPIDNPFNILYEVRP